MLKSLRNAFFSGLLLVAPVGVTIFVINFLVDLIGRPTREFFFFFLPREVIRANPWIGGVLDVLSTLLVLVLITILGWFSKLLIGRFFIETFERIVTNVPFVKTVYLTVKQIIDTFSQQKKAVFQKAVLLEYPRHGIYAIAFLTSEGKGEVQHRTDEDVVSVFLPTTPNPTSGFLLMVPKQDIVSLQMTIGDAMKLIISGGAVVPIFHPKTGESISVSTTNPALGRAESSPQTTQP